MQRASSQAFPQFGRLPAELRIQVWQETCPLPGIHAFDVCIPSSSDGSFQTQNKRIGDEKRWEKLKCSVFLDQIQVPQAIQRQCCNGQCEISPEFDFDPSAYRVKSFVQSSCFEAFTSLRISPRRVVVPRRPVNVPELSNHNVDSNSVYLPARDKWVLYDNQHDLLFLRFGGPVQVDGLLDEHGYARTFESGLSDILFCPWSSEFAATLQNARRVAIDITELSPVKNCSEHAIYQEIAYLSSCLQNDLEVLYVVDHLMSQCGRCGKDRSDRSSLPMTGELVKRLSHGPGVDGRQPDVFYGNGVTYHEILALEELGWRKDSSMFRILEIFSNTIRAQQGDGGCFRGVRVLACQYDAQQ